MRIAGEAYAGRARGLIWISLSLALLLAFLIPLILLPISSSERQRLADPNLARSPVALVSESSDARGLMLVASASQKWQDVESIELQFATFLRTVSLKEAKLIFQAGQCEFQAQNLIWRDNDTVRFVRQSCQLSSPVGEARLLVRLADPSDNLALWVGTAPLKKADELQLRSGSDPKTLAHGALYFAFPTAIKTRLQLLGAMWAPALHPGLFVFLYLVSIGSLAVLLMGPWSRRWRVAIFTAGTAFSWSLFFAVITPPLQAPDEADHFLTFAHYFGRTGAQAEALEAMNRSHYFRTFCKDDGHLTAFDLQHPQCEPWPEHAPIMDLELRSPGVRYMWWVYDKFIPHKDGLSLILSIRCLNALVIALTLAFFAYGLEAAVGGGFGFSILGAASLLPSFWILSGHVSNHVFISLGYIANAAVLLLSLRLRRIPTVLILGASLLSLLSLSMGRASLLSLLVLHGLLLLGFLQPWSVAKRSALALAFLNGALFLSLFAFKGSLYVTNLVHEVEGHTGSLALVSGGLVLLEMFICLALLGVGSWLRSRRVLWPKIWSLLLIVTFVGLLFIPLWTKMTLDNIEVVSRPEKWVFMKNIYLTLFTNLGLTGDDFLMIRTLWGGFGCPDNFFPKLMIEIPKFVMLCGIFLVSVSAVYAKRSDVIVRDMWIKLLVFGYLGMIALACWQAIYSIHGRYTLGWVLMMHAMAFYGFDRLLRRTGRGVYFSLCLTVSVGIPASSALVLLFHYYQ